MRLLILTALCSYPLMADLAPVRAEPNLEKRSRLALDNADRSLKESRKAYDEGDLQKATDLLEELEKSVELAETSLKETGKDPHRNPRHFKYAEIKTSELLRRLDGFSRDMNSADRPMIDNVKHKVQETHDRLLHGIMTGKKK